MRTQINIYDAFNRDTSWITQEVIETYAGAKLRGERAADIYINSITRGDAVKIQLFMELVYNHPDLILLQDELIAEFGEETFIGKARSKEFHIRQLEERIENEKDAKALAPLIRELRELRQWTVKPFDSTGNPVSVTVNTGPSSVNFNRDNPREAERIVMSIFSSL